MHRKRYKKIMGIKIIYYLRCIAATGQIINKLVTCGQDDVIGFGIYSLSRRMSYCNIARIKQVLSRNGLLQTDAHHSIHLLRKDLAMVSAREALEITKVIRRKQRNLKKALLFRTLRSRIEGQYNSRKIPLTYNFIVKMLPMTNKSA